MSSIKQLPTFYTRYGDIISRYVTDVTEEMSNILYHLADDDGHVYVAVENGDGQLHWQVAAVKDATSLCCVNSVAKNVFTYVRPSVGVSLRLPYEQDGTPFGLTRTDVEDVLGEFPFDPTFVVDCGDEGVVPDFVEI